MLQETRVCSIMGDFNYLEINFEHYEVSASVDSSPAKFFDKNQDMFLIQFVLSQQELEKIKLHLSKI